MRLILFIILSLNTYSSITQCLITKTEYDHIIIGLEEIDLIVGLWHISGHTNVYQGESLSSSINEPTLDYWFIVHDSSSYMVYHKEYSDVQNFTASFSPISLENYSYSTVYDTGEKVETEALLLDAMLHDINIKKLIQYKFIVPPKKASEFILIYPI